MKLTTIQQYKKIIKDTLSDEANEQKKKKMLQKKKLLKVERKI